MTEPAPYGQTPSSATLACPNCQSTITYYDVSGSSYYGCSTCHTFFEYEHEGPPKILASFFEKSPAITLPIGTEGYLHGQFVRVVGIMHKKEAEASYSWLEYILLRKDGQYVQLAEFDGHWMYIEPTKKTYKEYHGNGNVYYVDAAERQYRLYNRYRPKVLYAVGEFDWHILEDEKLSISEYINPPYILVSEQANNRADWYTGQHISRDELATAFAISVDALPRQYGIGAVQPADEEGRLRTAFSAMSLIGAVLILLQLVISFTRPSKQLLSATYQTQADSAQTALGSAKPIVTSSFEVDGPTALLFDMHSDLNNQWVELSVNLINEQSGRTYEFAKTLEYYYGVESGESWSEGSRDDDAVLARIPSGRYHLNIYPATEAGHFASFSLTVRQTSLIWGNILFMLAILAAYPILLYCRRLMFESRRWTNSDFTNNSDN
ncbi:hypothetical protein GCM10027341_22830 [Spirosoma knui]